MRSHGLESPIWLSKAVIVYAPPERVKQAVLDLIEHYDTGAPTNAFESIDRLVQVAATGRYCPPESEDITEKYDVELSEEDEDLIKKFGDLLNGLDGETSSDDDEPDEIDEN